MQSQEENARGTYGATLDAPTLVETLAHVFDANLAAARYGELPTPACVWGPHGIGKTALVRQLARSRGWHFVEVAPAQIEELGDLHGLPTRVDTGSGKAREGRTAFLPPEWVPREKGPGILLLDDLNRADERVLRALMQLLQNHRLYSWALPEGWQIVCTANPESGDYNVTAMDDALVTRMLHFTLAFDARAWAQWARSAGIDERGIEFVTTYPEAAVGRRTTPRTLVQFFRQVASITDLAADRQRVARLAQSTLDPSTAAAFVRFSCDEMRALPDADEVLDASLPQIALEIVSNASRDASNKRRLRVDRLGLIIARIEAAIDVDGYVPGKHHAANLKALLASEEIPRDLAMRLHRTLSRRNLGALVRDRAVSKRLLSEVPF
jgi:MoxR-like ATPase